jgi:hypothetical protein
LVSFVCFPNVGDVIAMPNVTVDDGAHLRLAVILIGVLQTAREVTRRESRLQRSVVEALV